MARMFIPPSSWVGGEVPQWERKRFVLQEGNRDTRSMEIQKMKEYYRRNGRRPPLTKEQQIAGARRIA